MGNQATCSRCGARFSKAAYPYWDWSREGFGTLCINCADGLEHMRASVPRTEAEVQKLKRLISRPH